MARHELRTAIPKLFLVFSVVFLFSCLSNGGRETSITGRTVKTVLFVGNSLTFTNDLPRQVKLLAADLGTDLKTDSVAVPSASLRYHDSAAFPRTRELIGSGEYDVVILQGGSAEPLVDPEGFADAASSLAALAGKAGARVLFYETWAYAPDHPNKVYEREPLSGGSPQAMQVLLRSAYTKAASDTHSRVAPIGDAFELALTVHPEIRLYSADGVHPNERGSYLAACVFVKELLNVDPRYARWKPEAVNEEQAAVLRNLAGRVGA